MPLLVALAACSGVASAGDADDLRLVPFPKEVRRLAGEFALGRALRLEAPGAQAEVLGRLLNEELRRAGLGPVQVRTREMPGPESSTGEVGGRQVKFLCRVKGVEDSAERGAGGQGGETAGLVQEGEDRVGQRGASLGDHPESYALDVRSGEVICAASDAAGLHYGLQTLCQLIRANRRGNVLPCLAIRDWPSLRWRCFQDDMTRGPSSRLETLQFEASIGSFLKFNLMTFYMEYQYAFEKHPRIGPPDGSLTPDELSALVAYAKPLQIDILGNQQSFGHFGHILKHPEYAALRETADVLTPVREETYGLLDDLYSGVCPLLPFPWFNVCCDETWGLGTGPSKTLASEIGVGGVYVRHIRRVHALLKEKYAKRMMMWGDIILQHPDQLEQIPKDTLMLTWGYDARPSFEDQIIPFAKSGYEFFVCPGVNNWSRILPDFGVAITNIQHFVRDGVKHGALGMLNTDWEDDGEAINAVKWHADAWAAECAWNGSTTSIESFNRRVGAVLFGEAGDHFGRAVAFLARTHRLPAMKGMMNARFWEDDFVPKAQPAAIESNATNLLGIVRPAIECLERCRAEARCNQQVLDAFLFGARRMELIGQRMLDGLEAARLYQTACAANAGAEELAPVERLIRKNRDAHEALGRTFASLWLAESEPYALDWTMRRYTNTVEQYDARLRAVAAARVEAAAGRGLPAPEKIGLSLPKPLARRIKPRQIFETPLGPELPWADARATHRLGLIIEAGAADRFDLPVEIEVGVPPALASKPMRAFLLDGKRSPRELLAQLDPPGQGGSSRLALILDDLLPKGEQASVHVYLGLSRQPGPMPQAVGTRTDHLGRQWIENDKIRAVLGTEGAHVYRWEVKSAAHRDLTMPGESGWAGFSDIASYRHSAYRVSCTAHGPALVEFHCVDVTGHQKTLRFYGGASWMEVWLGDPTSLYWDFDNPKNFAADGSTPGTWLFSNGETGAVGREADGVPAQIRAQDTLWGVKFNADKVALGLITPGTPAIHHVAPGAGAGGVGIENSMPAQHFVTYAGLIEGTPAQAMDRLESALDLKQPISVILHALQAR
ncbi:MAG TPA: glycoside hydrolase family 20 zincin-like fold domain-containing protein [Verrucomicrobiota bacterium]|nr:glycoside hydrolase family 20 zincin-like fold domain-containing protein [Verrucomicrobiota bacterium]